MREILFRGYSRPYKKWFYGSFISPYFILPEDADCFDEYEEVLSQTVGQFTGLLDKNGKKIFEGDYRDGDYVVKWNPLHCCFGWFSNNGYIKPLRAELYDKSGKVPQRWFVDEKIIGNIHETNEGK